MYVWDRKYRRDEIWDHATKLPNQKYKPLVFLNSVAVGQVKADFGTRKYENADVDVNRVHNLLSITNFASIAHVEVVNC